MSDTEQTIKILAIESSCDWPGYAIECNFFTDCSPYIIWRGCTGDRIEKAY